MTEPTGTKDLYVVRLLIFESDLDCVQDVLDNVIVPDFIAKVN